MLNLTLDARHQIHVAPPSKKEGPFVTLKGPSYERFANHLYSYLSEFTGFDMAALTD